MAEAKKAKKKGNKAKKVFKVMALTAAVYGAKKLYDATRKEAHKAS